MTSTGSSTSGGSSRGIGWSSVMTPWTPAPSASSTCGTNQTTCRPPRSRRPRRSRRGPRSRGPTEGQQDVVGGVGLQVGQVRRLAGAVADLDAGMVARPPQTHAHRLLGVQQGVGDHLGDADARRLDQLGRPISVSTWVAHRRASDTPRGPGVKACAGRFNGMSDSRARRGTPIRLSYPVETRIKHVPHPIVYPPIGHLRVVRVAARRTRCPKPCCRGPRYSLGECGNRDVDARWSGTGERGRSW